MRSWEQVLWKGVMVGLSSVLLAGCANPHLIESVQETGDWDLDCDQLQKEILLVDTYRKEADAEQGTTGTNFMAGLLFGSTGIAYNQMVSKEAEEKAEARRKHLYQIFDEKRCSQKLYAATIGAPTTVSEAQPAPPLPPTPQPVPEIPLTPPRIVVIHPEPGSRTQESSVVLVWSIVSQKPLVEWTLSLNGEPAASTRDIQVQPRQKGTEYRLRLQRQLDLKAGENTIVLQAEDEAQQYAKVVLLVYREPAVVSGARVATSFRGQRWAVVIGLSRYQHAAKGIPNLRYADRDARAFYEFLKTPQGGAFTEDHIRFLTDEQATYPRVREALFDFLRQPIKEDLVIIFYAGHGVPEPGNPKNLYLLTYDSDPEHLASTAFPMWDLETTLTRFVKAERVLVLTDACHSAGVGAELTTRSDSPQNLINRYLQELSRTGTGRAIFTASEANELSQESERWGGGHGVFTHFLLESLSGNGDTNDDGIVTLGEAMDYVSEHVRRATHNAQHPATSGHFDRSMPLAVLR